nr:immunoglobulin heavy chain junction region [Homo sapiens]
LCETGVGGLL